MATLAPAPTRRIATDRQFFGGMALAMLALTAIGFAPTYYLSSYFPRAPTLPAVVHVHGLVFTAWMLVYAAQTGFIAAGRRDLHRLTGTAAIALAAAMLVVGPTTAIWVARNGSTVPHPDPLAFMINPLTAVALFGVFAAVGIWRRDVAAYHKRAMFLATLAIVQTPLARIARMLGSDAPPVGGMILSDLLLAALVAYDWKRRGRLHPATRTLGGILLVSQPVRLAIGSTDAWHRLAATLVA